MSYFEDRYGGYVGHDPCEPPPRPTFEQVQVLRKLADSKKLTDRQRAALKAMIRWSDAE